MKKIHEVTQRDAKILLVASCFFVQLRGCVLKRTLTYEYFRTQNICPCRPPSVNGGGHAQTRFRSGGSDARLPNDLQNASGITAQAGGRRPFRPGRARRLYMV